VPSSMTRRPVPALVALLALLVLTGIVWWRVLHRDTTSNAGASCPTPTPTVTATLPAPSAVTVRVLNATDRTGIAAKARSTLVADGFAVPQPAGNDTRYKGKVPGIADIRYGPKGKQAALLLRYYLPGARLMPTSSGSATVVVSLGARYRGVAAPATVQQALSRARIAVASASPAAPSPSPTC
jgi:LytR cell envelope-related transcriptional attenuator